MEEELSLRDGNITSFCLVVSARRYRYVHDCRRILKRFSAF